MILGDAWEKSTGILRPVTFHIPGAAFGVQYDIVPALIQSNMRGVATDWDSSDQYPDNVYMWSHALGGIVKASESQSMWEPGTGMGASNTFLKDYAATSLAAGRRLLVINVARGGTGFTTPSTNSAGTGFHWRYDLTDNANNLARRSVEVIQEVVAAAGPGAQIVAFLANHGSTDGTNNTAKATFKTYLQAWITWLRTTLATPNVPYVMMQMRPDLLANESRHRVIGEAQAETANELPKVGYALSPVGSPYYKADSVHFNAAGMRVIGHNLFTKYSELVDISAYRASLVAGDFFPSAGKVGIYWDESALTSAAGVTISGNNGVFENRVYTGKVTVTGSGNTFRNCLFIGTAGALGTDIGECVLSTGINTTFTDCTFRSNTKHGNGITGRFFKLLRCEIYECGDGVRIQPQGLAAGNRVDVTIDGTWIHDLVMWDQSWPSGYNVTHNDCIQWLGGKGLAMTGSRLENFYSPNYGHWAKPDTDSGGTGSANHVTGNHYRVMNAQYGSCIMFNREGASDSPDEFVALKCWFNGGPAAFNIGDVDVAPLSALSSVDDCWFGWDFKSGTGKPRTLSSNTFILGGGTSYGWSGNKRWGNSSWTHGTLTDPGGGADYVWAPSGAEATVNPFESSTTLDNSYRNN